MKDLKPVNHDHESRIDEWKRRGDLDLLFFVGLGSFIVAGLAMGLGDPGLKTVAGVVMTVAVVVMAIAIWKS